MAEQADCNCKNPAKCPVNNRCQDSCVIYRADVKSKRSHKVFIGKSLNAFKKRYNGYKRKFKMPQDKREPATADALAKHIWRLKDEEQKYKIEWKIIEKVDQGKCGQSDCDLCLKEHGCIEQVPESQRLNPSINKPCTCKKKLSPKNKKRDKKEKTEKEGNGCFKKITLQNIRKWYGRVRKIKKYAKKGKDQVDDGEEDGGLEIDMDDDFENFDDCTEDEASDSSSDESDDCSS